MSLKSNIWYLKTQKYRNTQQINVIWIAITIVVVNCSFVLSKHMINLTGESIEIHKSPCSNYYITIVFCFL